MTSRCSLRGDVSFNKTCAPVQLPSNRTFTVCLRSTAKVCPSKRRSCFQTFVPLRRSFKNSTGGPPGRVVEMGGIPWKGGGLPESERNGGQRGVDFSRNVC